ncbi:alpha/beta fold hydrolase [Mycobacterium sp.]|uniref:alpha/beta hydrolase n=1 Tax=Mycobacterium sp. TaxID=1785 RepID=UPI001289FD92|nr:alpha/beta fold hydrolase [Mycobacterium sp.]KAA8969630.1 MAG: alpha/beta hydrolase [Mycobacterium sp.]
MTSDTTPADQPIPLPELRGADAGAAGLPHRSALSRRQRAFVDVSALSDIGLRTAVATVLAATMTPPVLATALRRSESHRERDNLNFYAELAEAGSAAKSFPPPTSLPQVSSRPAGSVAERRAHGNVETISFASSFEAVNPAMRKRWRSLRRNNVVWAQHWRHDDGPRPTLCVIHGFMASSYLLNGLFFTLPWYYRSGYDVVLYSLPFHGRRSERYSPFSGYGYFAHGLSGFAEATAQAVHDFRSLLHYLRHTGVERIALTGISLGGYTSALIASADDRLDAVIPNCPAVTPIAMFDDWFPASELVSLGLRIAEIGRDELAAALSYHCPLNYRPLPTTDRRLIITGLGDRFAPPEQSEMLWRHWDHCALHWFPGSHLMHISKLEYLRRMTRFLHGFMFG